MLTKYKIILTVIPNSILIFIHLFDYFVVILRINNCTKIFNGLANHFKIFFQEWDPNPRPHYWTRTPFGSALTEQVWKLDTGALDCSASYLFQEKNPNGLMREDQMNEISVNFEPLVQGKFVKFPSMRLFL